jgi:hypothetical protein
MSISRLPLLTMTIAASLATAPAARAGELFDLLKPGRYIDADKWHMADHCDTGWVLSYIKARFDGKVRAYVGNKLFITTIYGAKLHRARPRDDEHLVGRQYCKATVTMTDGKARDIFYTLEYPWGYAGNLTHVEFCIPGMDPEHVYGRLCSTVR